MGKFCLFYYSSDGTELTRQKREYICEILGRVLIKNGHIIYGGWV